MNRKIVHLAIPNIISSISVPLIGIVDIDLMGRMGSPDYIGAIAHGSLILNFIYLYIGATAGKAMRNSMIMSSLLVFFPAFIILRRIIGNHGLWAAFIHIMISRTVSPGLMAQKSIYNRIKVRLKGL